MGSRLIMGRFSVFLGHTLSHLTLTASQLWGFACFSLLSECFSGFHLLLDKTSNYTMSLWFGIDWMISRIDWLIHRLYSFCGSLEIILFRKATFTTVQFLYYSTILLYRGMCKYLITMLRKCCFSHICSDFTLVWITIRYATFDFILSRSGLQTPYIFLSVSSNIRFRRWYWTKGRQLTDVWEFKPPCLFLWASRYRWTSQFVCLDFSEAQCFLFMLEGTTGVGGGCTEVWRGRQSTNSCWAERSAF